MFSLLLPLLVLGGVALASKPSVGALEDDDDSAPGSSGFGTLSVLNMKEIQKRLQALGFYSGPIHGYFTAETAEGIEDFQDFANFSVTGKPDAPTIREIWDSYNYLQGEYDDAPQTFDFAYPFGWPEDTFVDGNNVPRDGSAFPANMYVVTPKAGSKGHWRINVEWNVEHLALYDKKASVDIVVGGNGYFDGQGEPDREWIARYLSIVNSVQALAGQFPETLFAVRWGSVADDPSIEVNWREAEDWGGFFERDELEAEFNFNIPNTSLVEQIADGIYELE
jgi:hypothetical protein